MVGKESVGKTSVRYRGRKYTRYKAGYSPRDREFQEKSGNKRDFLCECGTSFGRYHELGCDLEYCPICKGQLLSCGHMDLFKTRDMKKRNPLKGAYPSGMGYLEVALGVGRGS